MTDERHGDRDDRIGKEAGLSSDDAIETAVTRPWRRYFARLIDIILFEIVGGGVAGVLFPDAVDSHERLLNLVLLAAYVPFDALALAMSGASIGKALYGVHVERPGGLGFASALRRAFLVWCFGLGAGVPLVSLFTLVASYQRLIDRGSTRWDDSTGCRVVQARISTARWTLIAIVWLAIGAIVAVGLYV